MNLPAEFEAPSRRPHLVIWHTEGTAISGLLSWMWRLKESLPTAGLDLTLASLEIQTFRFPQLCATSEFYDARLRTPQEFLAFLKQNQSAVHLINHAYEYVDLLEKISPALLQRMSLVGICHTDQDYYYQNLERLDPFLAGIIGVSPRCVERLEALLPHRRGTMPVLPDWDMPLRDTPPRAATDSRPLRVLFNGRILHLQKRVLDLPAISQRLAELGANVELTLVGDGPDLPELRSRLAGGRHVPGRILSPRAPWEMAQLLAEHDVFLQVSEFEGASVSLMEAMMAGLVPVVTRTESGTELLVQGNNALLAPVGDVNAIAEAISTLATNRGRLTELANAAQATARTSLRQLDYAHTLRKYVEDLQAVPA